MRDDNDEYSYVKFENLRSKSFDHAGWRVGFDYVDDDMTHIYIHHNIWAQRLTGKCTVGYKIREGRSTNDGGLELTNSKNIGRAKEGDRSSNRGEGTRTNCGAYASGSDAEGCAATAV
eukprot:16449473-Heterocapsa_arctica.AAC.1